MKTYAKLCAIFLICIFIPLAACTKKPTVSDFWMDETYVGQQYGRILVIGAAKKITYKNLFEGELVNQLRSLGIEAVPSYEILPYNSLLTRETVLTAVEKYDIDSVLITSLVDSTKKTVYYAVQNTNPYIYYNGLYDAIRLPGRTATYDVEILFLKTNLYDVSSEKLIWSITSESEYKYSVKSLDSAITLVINKLREDGLI